MKPLNEKQLDQLIHAINRIAHDASQCCVTALVDETCDLNINTSSFKNCSHTTFFRTPTDIYTLESCITPDNTSPSPKAKP